MLNPSEQRFVDEYLLTGNASEAARKAGYPDTPHTGVLAHRLIKRPEIQTVIQSRMDERSARSDIEADLVLQGILALIRRCETGEPQYTRAGDLIYVQNPDDKTGEMIILRKADIPSALKGYELLGKHLRLFTEQTEVVHSGEIGVKHTLDAIGFDEVRRMAAAKRKTAEVIEGETVLDS